MFDKHRVEIDWAGRPLILETGGIARQADGAVFATYGDTKLLATVCGAHSPKPGLNFFPLTVNYMEKFYAAGKVPGGYFKREGRPTERETLISRLTDRPIRPLFPKGYKNEVQIVITVLQHDLENEPDIIGMIAASAALSISGLPFMGPIAASRVGLIDGDYVLNPTIPELEESELDLVVAGTSDAVMMVESEAKELTEEQMLGAVMFAHESCEPVIEAIIKLAEKAAKEPREFTSPDYSAEKKLVAKQAEKGIKAAYKKTDKMERQELLRETKDAAWEKLGQSEDNPDSAIASNPSNPKPFAGLSLRQASGLTAVSLIRFARLNRKRVSLSVHMVRPCLRAAKHRHFAWPHSAHQMMSNLSIS